jgi:hypothetical protein
MELLLMYFFIFLFYLKKIVIKVHAAPISLKYKRELKPNITLFVAVSIACLVANALLPAINVLITNIEAKIAKIV